MWKTATVNVREYGLGFNCSRERTQQTTDKHDFESGDLRMTTTIDGKLKRPLVKVAPLFYESVFLEKKQGQQCWRQSSESRESRLFVYLANIFILCSKCHLFIHLYVC